MQPRRNPDSVSRELGDGEIMVLVPASTGDVGEAAEQAVVLNAVGTAVWHLADGEHDIEAITAFIVQHFPDVSPDQVRDDVNALIRQLLQHGAFLS